MNCISAIATINDGIIASATINDGIINSFATIVDSGISDSFCPIIISIDGGDASTITYPPVNGLLNGGTA